MRRLLRRTLNRLRYRRFDADVAEELAFHRSMAGAEGEADLDRRMGNELRMRERAREVWIPPRLDALAQDVRLAVRLAMRHPLRAATIIAVLAVGASVATVTFALVDALLLRPLPVERPGELVYMRFPSYSFPQIQEVSRRSTFLSGSFAWTLEQYDTDFGDGRQPVLVMLASGTMYETLGVKPQVGRLLAPTDEEAAGAAPVAVLSDRAWRLRFAANTDAIGRTVRIGDAQVTIVGVTQPEFFGVAPGRSPDLTVPVTLAPLLKTVESDVLRQPSRSWLHFMGRLAPGRALAAADAEFQTVWPQVLEVTTPTTLPPERRARFLSRRSGLEPGAAGYSSVRNQFRQPLLVVAAFSAMLLLITCASAATMLLAVSWGRSREMAVRVALGCGRLRLAGQLFVEAAMLALVASAIALAIVPAAVGAVVSFATTSNDPIALDVAADPRLTMFTVALVAVVAMLFSATPLVFAVRLAASDALRGGARHTASSVNWVGRGLVAAQIACAVLLLVAASLFLRSLGLVTSNGPGFDSAPLVIARASPTASAREVVDRMTAVRGVLTAAVSAYPPISGDDGGMWTQSIGVNYAEPAESERRTFMNVVSPGFFDTLDVSFSAGRDFRWTDDAGSEGVVIINRSAARRFFGDSNPLGQRLTVGLAPTRRNLFVVGVVGDVRYQWLHEEPSDIVYLPHAQAEDAVDDLHFVTMRVPALSEDVARELRSAVAESGPVAPRLQRLDERIRESLVTERALALVAVALAACAAFLAGAGVFGSMAHSVARRTTEIGVRMALGARASQVLRQIIVQSLVVAILGLLPGLLAAWAGAQWIAGLLHGISPSDPATYLAVAGVIVGITLIAAIVPARRAAAVEPLTALRAD